VSHERRIEMGESITVRARESWGRLPWPEDVEVCRERTAGEFTRAIRLPEGTHAEAIRGCEGREASRDYGGHSDLDGAG
jgi:hypothetical protein